MRVTNTLKPTFKVRNIANVTLVTVDGVRIGVRCIITHDNKLYAERKDNQRGEYEYCRLKPNSNYSLRPFEEVTSEIWEHNLHIRSINNDCLNILNRYIYEIGDKMFKRQSAMFSTIKQPKQKYYIGISYYNDKRITLNELKEYTR